MNMVYNSNSVVGIYEDIVNAKSDLLKLLKDSGYMYDIDLDYDDYLLLKCCGKKGIEFPEDNILCFEIVYKSIGINNIMV